MVEHQDSRDTVLKNGVFKEAHYFMWLSGLTGRRQKVATQGIAACIDIPIFSWGFGEARNDIKIQTSPNFLGQTVFGETLRRVHILF